ncbi:MAG: FecR domain-containing protein [Algicola sp.]|nr:FecR domain-containing protein [Algicola sp.]
MNLESNLVTRLVLLFTLTIFASMALANNSVKRCRPIFKDGVIKTLAQSKTQLKMTDGTMIALKAHSELQIDMGDGYSNVISMTLFKGSLRTVPGSIDETSGHYRLKTPVGKVISTSAHFEVDIIDDAVFLSVWTGSLDFVATVGKPAVNIRLGEGQGYSHAKIDAKGLLTLLNKGR